MAHFAVLTRHGIRVVHRLRVETGNLPVSEIRMQAAGLAVAPDVFSNFRPEHNVAAMLAFLRAAVHDELADAALTHGKSDVYGTGKRDRFWIGRRDGVIKWIAGK
jgi:hypothetical protein